MDIMERTTDIIAHALHWQDQSESCMPSSTSESPREPTKTGTSAGPSSTPEMASPSMPYIVDINSLIETYAWNQFRDVREVRGSEYKNVERDHVRFEIDTCQLLIMRGRPKYESLRKTEQRPYTLFKSIFRNDTSRPHSYSFKTDRSTESVCTVFKEEGFMIGAEAELTLKTPGEIMEAKAGFKHEMTFAKGTESSVTEILTWGVDSMILVPANCTTTAKLVVEEEHYEGHFSTVTLLTGNVTCSLIRRKDNILLLPVQATIGEIISTALNRQTKVAKQLRAISKMSADQQTVEMLTKGTCHFQFATEQRVVLHEETKLAEKGCQTEKDENLPHSYSGHMGFTSALRSPSPFKTEYHINRYAEHRG